MCRSRSAPARGLLAGPLALSSAPVPMAGDELKSEQKGVMVLKEGNDVKAALLKLSDQDRWWWKDAKFGMFIHWGLYAIPATGLSLGEQNLYEFGGMHVPLVIAGPGIPNGKIEAFVYLMDLFPTFAEFSGAKVLAGVEGQSIVPILTGKQTKVRAVLYTGYRDCQRSIRGERWKLIRHPLVDHTQLFDLGTDPHELDNLAGQPEQAARVTGMTALLQKEMTSRADVHPLTVANPKPAEWSPPVGGGEPRKKANKTAK